MIHMDMIHMIHMDIHTDLFYSHIGHDVISCFRAEVNAKQIVENTASDGLGWNFSRTVQARITTFYRLIGNNLPHKPAGYEITSCFRSAAKCNNILH